MKLTRILVCLLALCLLPLVGLAEADNTVIIYSSAEEYRNEYFQKRLMEQFPDYNITIEYLTSGTQAARLMAEGDQTPCDMSYDMEYGYIEKLADLYAPLPEYDTSVFLDELVDPQSRYFPETRNGGCIAINPKVLEDKGVPVPASYQDLIKPEYKGLISMPNPKSSGTGYMFLKSLVNAWGEEEAFEYFDALAENILQFTSSGSGPVNALVQGEAGIGLAMTSQTVTKINEGVDLQSLFFEEGSPWSLYAYGIIAGKEDKQAVRDVFDFFYTTLVDEDKELFFPEKIYKDKDFVIENFPTDIEYADMSNNGIDEKERLLEQWAY